MFYGYGYTLHSLGGLVPPVNTVAPAITGTAEVGQTLTCSTGTWSGSPTYAYQWKRGGVNIVGATNSTYTLVSADAGTSIKCTVTATNGAGSATADSNTVSATWEADAQAFITAASITDPTQQSAVNQLVVDLKGYSLWSKMKAVYPLIGGTSTTTKWNLKDPRDLDAAYRITWSGGLTFANTGVTPNGINGYGYTWFNQSTNFNSNTDASIGLYLRTNTVSDNADMGAGNTTTGADGMLIYAKFSNVMYANAMGSTLINAGVANTDSRGFFAASRISGVHSMYKRGTSTINNSETEAATSPLNGDIRIGSGNPLAGGAQVYSNREMAFAYIGDGLTQAQIDNLYTAVQTFQTTLSRNV